LKWEAILFFLGCLEVNSTWLITSELSNQYVLQCATMLYSLVWYILIMIIIDVIWYSSPSIPHSSNVQLQFYHGLSSAYQHRLGMGLGKLDTIEKDSEKAKISQHVSCQLWVEKGTLRIKCLPRDILGQRLNTDCSTLK